MTTDLLNLGWNSHPVTMALFRQQLCARLDFIRPNVFAMVDGSKQIIKLIPSGSVNRNNMKEEADSRREFLKTTINDILLKKEESNTIEELRDEASLTRDLGLDSLDLAEMTVHLEDKYGVDVFEEDLVDEVHEVLEKLDI